VTRAVIAVVIGAACSREPSDASLADVTRGDLVLEVVVSGELEAVDSTDVKPPSIGETWNFKIANLAAEGSAVKAGDPVVAFDPSDLIHDLETMQNEAEAAQKKLDKKRDDAALARRDEQLKIAEAEAALNKAKLKTDAPNELLASVELKTLELDARSAKVVLERAHHRADQQRRSDTSEIASLADHLAYAKHRVASLQASVARMTVAAPRLGTIVFPTSWRGEKKKVGDSAWRMETVVKIVGLDKMIGDGQLDEVDLARVAVKQRVALRLDAQPDVQLRGTVASIAKTLHAKSNVDPSLAATVKIDLEAGVAIPLRPGMRFRGTIETGRIAGVVQVPAEAVFVAADGPVVYRARGGGLDRTIIKLGRRSATAIEVTSGLEPGDRVSRVDPERGGR
jgi:HlyD family secretion protein